MIQKNKKLFVPNKWVIGNFQGIDFIGRTIRINEEEIVSYINEFGLTKTVRFNEIKIVKLLTVDFKTKIKVKKQKTKQSSAIEDLIIRAITTINLN